MTPQRKIFLIVIISFIGLTSCKKETSGECYDKTYHEKHKNDICPADCPGVIGCDGKTYCNECNMHASGIKKVQ